MTLPNLWGSLDWAPIAGLFLVAGLLIVLWSYRRAKHSASLRWSLAILKGLGLVLLAVCLLEPLFSESRPRPGANLFVVMADASRSLQIRDRALGQTREAEMQKLLHGELGWQSQLDEDFDLRRYTFAEQLDPVTSFADYKADGSKSAIVHALETVSQRFHDRPHGGILLLTDGSPTGANLDSIDWSEMPPVFPVVIGGARPNRDLNIVRVSVSQTNFEATPVTISTELVTQGFAGRNVVVQLVDESGVELQRQTVTAVEDHKRFAVRFETRPENPGVSFYEVRAFEQAAGNPFDGSDNSGEATLVNNRRLVSVDRGQGPYRVLYVCGRPNWELKFLQRAVLEDDEVDLVSLVRIAKREAKFTFRGHLDETTNPLFRGFGNQRDEQAEQYDEPVTLRLGTRDAEELRDGFPKEGLELFQYDAIVLDDLEADFFTQDQKSLIQEFVSLRGGSLLMLGGQESFVNGGYDRSPIGELLPVYVDTLAQRREPSKEIGYRVSLTREGWLQPWIRLRPTEEQEQQRLTSMPSFKTVNRVTSIKPGASVLARVTSADGAQHPALVVQQFGKGRAGALLIADMWRWQLAETRRDDLMRTWRQIVRWMVGDVPRKVAVEVTELQDVYGSHQIAIRAKDESFRPLDNASVAIKTQRPDGSEVDLAVEPSGEEAGTYLAALAPREPGAYRAEIVVTAPDGSEVGRRDTGWASVPDKEEFQSLDPDLDFLERIAQATGGRMVEADKLQQFVNQVPNRDAIITDTRIHPWWHHWMIFSIVLALFVTEWGLRRWKGLP